MKIFFYIPISISWVSFGKNKLKALTLKMEKARLQKRIDHSQMNHNVCEIQCKNLIRH